MARVTALFRRRSGRVVIVIILRIELHIGVFGGHDESYMKFGKRGDVVLSRQEETVDFRVSNFEGLLKRHSSCLEFGCD